MELNRIYNMDCLEGMKGIPDGSIDCIICDLPYGSTSCEWDSVIPFETLWAHYKRICKPTSAIVLFGQEPFSSMLRLSNLADYKYDLYWEKESPTNVLQLKRRFGKNVETISVFYERQCTYNPQKYRHYGKPVTNVPISPMGKLSAGNSLKPIAYKDDGTRYPKQVLKYPRVDRHHILHPTQKPVDLVRMLVRSFTNEGDTILDNCMGSGTTAVAAVMENRRFIGFETNKEYCDIANKRLQDLTGPFKMFGVIGI